MTWQTFAFLIVAGAAFGYSGFRLKTLLDLMKAENGQEPKLDRIVFARASTPLLYVLGQKAVLRKKAAGLMHATIFWGFIIITIGTLEQFVSTLYQRRELRIHRAHALTARSFSFRISSLSPCSSAVLYACYRRLIVRPEGVGKSRDATIVLILTGSLMIAILLMNGFHILGARSLVSAPRCRFRTRRGLALGGLGFSADAETTLGTGFQMGAHADRAGLRDVHSELQAPAHRRRRAQHFLAQARARRRACDPINFEDEKVTQYGAAKITDMNWKDALDYYSCTECGRCQDLCPAYNTQKPLTPKTLIMDLKENMYRNKPAVLAGKHDEVTPRHRRERHRRRDLGLHLLPRVRDRLPGVHRAHGQDLTTSAATSS